MVTTVTMVSRGIIFDPERKLKGIGVSRVYSEFSAESLSSLSVSESVNVA